ncbi:reverse transcriptase domain-containing protein [Tanacetum coccineum]
MSATANTTPIVTTVTKATNKEKTPKEADAAPRVNILDFCEEHYEDILPVIMDNIRCDKYRNLSERPKMRERLKNNDGNVFGRLGIVLSVEVALTDGTLLAEIVLEAETAPERIDGYKDLKVAFLAYFMQQKKYVKDPMEIHNIKQRDGETIEDFMERFKVETGRMKGAPECMRISGFMHGVNNPELTKRLNEHVPKTMEEMMTATTTFIRGEAAAASKKKGHTS